MPQLRSFALAIVISGALRITPSDLCIVAQMRTGWPRLDLELLRASRHAREGWHGLGPGLVTGVADDDPSGISTYTVAGATYGYGLLWTSLLTLPMNFAVQAICAHIGVVTGRGLASNISRHYGRGQLKLPQNGCYRYNSL